MDSQRIYDICHWNWQKERVWGAKLDFFDQLIKATGRRWAHFSALNVAKTFLLMLTCTYTRWEHTKSYTCENCGETVIGKKILDNHMRKHNTAVTGLKRSHKCEECPYETKDKANLSKHTKRVHSVHSEKPKKIKKAWECGECGKISEQRPFWHTCEITQRPS